MSKAWLPVLAFCAALGSGLVAGVFLAFSSFVMKALSRLPASQAIAAMQAINRDVIPSAFMAVFLATAAACLVLTIAAFFRWGTGAGFSLLAGSLLYLAGTFVVTMVFNVPLNNALAAAKPDSASAAELWKQYLGSWTVWNHVRTLAASAGLFLAARGILAAR